MNIIESLANKISEFMGAHPPVSSPNISEDRACRLHKVESDTLKEIIQVYKNGCLGCGAGLHGHRFAPIAYSSTLPEDDRLTSHDLWPLLEIDDWEKVTGFNVFHGSKDTFSVYAIECINNSYYIVVELSHNAMELPNELVYSKILTQESASSLLLVLENRKKALKPSDNLNGIYIWKKFI